MLCEPTQCNIKHGCRGEKRVYIFANNYVKSLKSVRMRNWIVRPPISEKNTILDVSRTHVSNDLWVTITVYLDVPCIIWVITCKSHFPGKDQGSRVADNFVLWIFPHSLFITHYVIKSHINDGQNYKNKTWVVINRNYSARNWFDSGPSITLPHLPLSC